MNAALKQAAVDLRRAVEVIRQEAEQLRREIDQKRREVDAQLNELRDQIRLKERDMGSRQENQLEPFKDRALKLREVTDMQQEISNKEHQFTRERDEVLAKIHEKEQEVIDLENQAKTYESRAAAA